MPGKKKVTKKIMNPGKGIKKPVVGKKMTMRVGGKKMKRGGKV